MVLILLAIVLLFIYKIVAPAWCAVQLLDHVLASGSNLALRISAALLGIVVFSRVRVYLLQRQDHKKAAALGAELPPDINGWAFGNIDMFINTLRRVEERFHSFLLSSY